VHAQTAFNGRKFENSKVTVITRADEQKYIQYLWKTKESFTPEKIWRMINRPYVINRVTIYSFDKSKTGLVLASWSVVSHFVTFFTWNHNKISKKFYVWISVNGSSKTQKDLLLPFFLFKYLYYFLLSIIYFIYI